MKSTQNLLRHAFSAILIVLMAATLVAAQSRGTLRGLITDELGAAIVGATVTLTDAPRGECCTAFAIRFSMHCWMR